MLAGMAVCVPACYAVVRRFDVEGSRWPVPVLVPIGRVLGFTSLSGKRPRSFLRVEAESPAGLAALEGSAGLPAFWVLGPAHQGHRPKHR